MKKALEVGGILFASAVLSCVLLYFFKPQALGRFSKNAGGGAGQEMKVEDFELLDHKGRSHDLHRQSGSKAVVLISTANGCSRIKQAVPVIKALRDKFAAQGVMFWMID